MRWTSADRVQAVVMAYECGLVQPAKPIRRPPLPDPQAASRFPGTVWERCSVWSDTRSDRGSTSFTAGSTSTTSGSRSWPPSRGAFFDVVDLGLATALAAVAGVWLVAKDWRDSSRRSGTRPVAAGTAPAGGAAPWVAPVRLAAHTRRTAALTAGIVNLVSAATPNSGWRHRFLLRNVESLDENSGLPRARATRGGPP